MMKSRLIASVTLVGLCLAAAALGREPSFQEHAAVQESLSRVHPRMRASWLRARGLDDSYYATFRRPESSGLACIGRWPWGPSWELAGRDTFLYLGSGSGVRILSIADSVHPRMLGQINARSLVSQVVVQDSLLFVACGPWGAQIYSVSDPANPRELGSMDAVIGDLCVKDTFCYTAGGGSFRIHNFADPTQPTQVGAVGDGGDVIAEANGYVYVGHGSSGSGLNVYDARDPHSPTLINTLGGVQLAMFTRGHWLFRISEQPAYFSILDISVPTSVHEVGRIDGYGGVAMYADARYAYLSGVYEHSGLFVVDISDSSHPQLRDSINPVGVAEWDPYVPHSPGYGYLADDYGGLVTIDMHNIDSISEAWADYNASMAVDVFVDGTRAYVADLRAGLRILDVQDPSFPQTLGEYEGIEPLDVRSAVAKDSFAFITWWGDNRRFMRVLDVTDPSLPAFAAEESCMNPPENLVLRDSLLYAAEANEFRIFNVARPRQPLRMGSCASTDGNYFGLAVQDSFAYVASQYGMWIINVAKPDSPFVVSSGIGLNAAGIAVRDTFVYLPYVYDTLLTYSVANPAQPRLLSSVKAGVWPSDIALGGSRGYVALNGGEGVETFDLTNPASPVSRGQTSAPFAVRGVCYSSGFVYATMWDAGVAVYETTALGVQEQPTARHKPLGLHVYPDVTDGHVRFIAGTVTQATSIDVYDISGRRMVEARVLAGTKGGVVEGEIDLSALAVGLYIIRIGSGGADFTAKVVKADRR